MYTDDYSIVIIMVAEDESYNIIGVINQLHESCALDQASRTSQLCNYYVVYYNNVCMGV